MHDRRSIIALICVLPLLGWGALALYFSASLPGTLSTVAAAGFGLISLLFFLVARTWKRRWPSLSSCSPWCSCSFC